VTAIDGGRCHLTSFKLHGWTGVIALCGHERVSVVHILQVVMGGMVPIAMAYRREMQEREVFLKSKRIQFVRHSWSRVMDLLHICGVITVGVGTIVAIFVALPELQDFPLILRKQLGDS
jgi:hypothetical protein